MAIVKGSPQQRNGVDCGVFMLQTGRSLMGIGAHASSIRFNQDHIDFYRYLIGAALINPSKYAPESVRQ